MSSSCAHKNCTIYERTSGQHQYFFEHGRYTGSEVSEDDLSGFLRVHCYDCGMNKIYSKDHLPLWLAPKWREARNCT